MSDYCGRFAPSPTGPLHFGSLFAATISYLHARAQDGRWLLRIEDLDPPREQAGAKDQILSTLLAHGFEWDEPILYQSDRASYYENQLAKLRSKGLSFDCPCSRKELLQNQGEHTEVCLTQQVEGLTCATKFRKSNASFLWHDQYQGVIEQTLSEDFVLKRKEGLYAYQLAVVCDDIDQGITHVVRGYDLLDSTPMQLALYQAFEVSPPLFSHFPVITSANGQKLSKQNLAPAIRDLNALQNLTRVFRYLGLDLSRAPKTVKDAMELAILAWRHEPPKMLNRKEIIESF